MEEFQPFIGIVLRTFPFGESDLILRVLSAKTGKRSVLARGVRKEKAKFSVAFDIFDAGEFTTKKGKGSLEVLVHFTPHKSLSLLRSDLDRFVTSSCIVEAFDNLTHENDEDEALEIYETLGLSLRAIEEAKDVKEMLRSVYLAISTLLRSVGFAAIDESKTPSLKNLELLLDATEHHSEKELKSKTAIKEVLQNVREKAKKEVQATSS